MSLKAPIHTDLTRYSVAKPSIFDLHGRGL
jgi:hypothetical protein